MIGLADLAGVAIYIALWWYLVRILKHTWAKALAILVALAIPFWDLPFGYLAFKGDCATYGGLHISQRIPASDTIFVDRHIAYRPEYLRRFGFKVVEYGEPGNITRYTATPTGYAQSKHLDAISTLKVSFVANQALPWGVIKRDFLVSRVDTSQVLASYSDLRWSGLWWQARAAPILSDGGRCYAVDENPLLTLIARGTS